MICWGTSGSTLGIYMRSKAVLLLDKEEPGNFGFCSAGFELCFLGPAGGVGDRRENCKVLYEEKKGHRGGLGG